MADIDIGQISEALNDKVDRNMRNVDTGVKADSVIDYQEPTAENGYTWYRKYASGWVEQGGIIAQNSSADITITFPQEMAGANYNWNINIAYQNTSSPSRQELSAWNFTTTTMDARCDSNYKKSWQVSGYAA